MGDTDIANYADDNTPYITADDIDGVVTYQENDSNILFKWFSANLFKGNANKSHLLVNVKDEVSMKRADCNIVNSKCEKLLAFKFDYKLTFNIHVSDLRKNTRRRLMR